MYCIKDTFFIQCAKHFTDLIFCNSVIKACVYATVDWPRVTTSPRVIIQPKVPVKVVMTILDQATAAIHKITTKLVPDI